MKKPRPNPDPAGAPKRLLVIRLGAIGDVLLAAPLIRMLKKTHPDSTIDFLAKNAYVSLLKSNRHIDGIHGFSPEGGIQEIRRIVRLIRSRHYDAVMDLQGNFRSRIFSWCSGAAVRSRAHLNRWRRFWLVRFRWDTYRGILPVPVKYLRAAPFPVADDGLGLELEIPKDVDENIRIQFRNHGLKNKRVVCLAPGAGRATKCWPVERFAEAGQALSEQGYPVVLIGGEKDAGFCRVVRERMRPAPPDFSGRLSLLETAALIKRCDLLVTNDTGVMHAASAVGTKTLALFGPTTRHFGFFPFRANAVVVEKPLACRPCSYHGGDHCPKSHFRCMLDISSGEVIEAAVNLLNAR